MSEPPVQKRKISNQEQDQLMAMYNLLPKEAQKEGYEGLTKSYTLIKDDAPGASKISVLVDKQVYYVYPVEALGKEDENLKINKQEKHFNIRLFKSGPTLIPPQTTRCSLTPDPSPTNFHPCDNKK